MSFHSSVAKERDLLQCVLWAGRSSYTALNVCKADSFVSTNMIRLEKNSIEITQWVHSQDVLKFFFKYKQLKSHPWNKILLSSFFILNNSNLKYASCCQTALAGSWAKDRVILKITLFLKSNYTKSGSMEVEKESSRNNLYVSKGISKIWRLHTDGCIWFPRRSCKISQTEHLKDWLQFSKYTLQNKMLLGRNRCQSHQGCPKL